MKIIFFDTTLRDGEQTPGAHISRANKVEIARQLERLGIDVIEAGFPAASNGDLKAVEAVCAAIKNSTVAALARTLRSDIDAAVTALKDAAKKRIHIFIATSDLHLEHKLGISREEAIERVRDAVSYARNFFDDIEFSAEDASRSDRDYLCRVIEAAIESGATTINIPDTVGYSLPGEFGELISYIKANAKGIDKAVISVHCHDDLGNATANSLEAIKCGALQIEGSINGLGERAGNAALEEIIMNLYTRREYYGTQMNINTKEITRTSRLVSSLFGITVPPNKAIVGANAFIHESGIHQHGVLKDRRTYEIMSPDTIGLDDGNIVLGKLSGKHAFAKRLAELGYGLDENGINECFRIFKNFADKKAVSDRDIRAIVNEYLDSLSSIYELDTFQIQSGNRMSAMAMITLSCAGESISEAAIGDGPIDAAFNAIRRLSGADDIKLEEYGIKAVTEGTDALGEAKVKITIQGASYSGRSVSNDIIEASIKAYINALNKWAAQ